MLTEQQMKNRMKGLGGSDVATVLGLNPWKTSYELWLEKTGRQEPEDISQKFAIRRGNDMEDLVAKWFSEDTDLVVHRVNKTLNNPDHPYLVAHIDRRVVGVKEGLECKTANWRMAIHFGEQGSDDVPANYLIQCMHYMIVTGWRTWHLAAELGGDFKIFKIEYDETLANHIAKTADEWWRKHVIDDVEPNPETARDLDLAYPSDSDPDPLQAEPEIVAAHRKLVNVKASIKELESDETALKNILKSAIGKHSSLIVGDHKLATWKKQGRKDLQKAVLKKDKPEIYAQYEKTTEFRVLRLSKPQEVADPAD